MRGSSVEALRLKALRDEAIIAAFRSGETMMSLSGVHRMSVPGIRAVLLRNGLTAKDGGRSVCTTPATEARDLMWVRLYQDGKTLAEIGDAYCVTRERVRQVLASHGIRKSDGGYAVGGGFLAERHQAARERKMQEDNERKAARKARQQARMELTGMPPGIALHKVSGLYFAYIKSSRLPGYHRTIAEAIEARNAALASPP